jgi:hypothetical protein
MAKLLYIHTLSLYRSLALSLSLQPPLSLLSLAYVTNKKERLAPGGTVGSGGSAGMAGREALIEVYVCMCVCVCVRVCVCMCVRE